MLDRQKWLQLFLLLVFTATPAYAKLRFDIPSCDTDFYAKFKLKNLTALSQEIRNKSRPDNECSCAAHLLSGFGKSGVLALVDLLKSDQREVRSYALSAVGRADAVTPAGQGHYFLTIAFRLKSTIKSRMNLINW